MKSNRKRVLKSVTLVVASLVLFLITFSYIYYLDLKKELVARISSEASSIIGQEVAIGDLSFSPAAGINVYDIRVLNPKGFRSGHLLKVRRLYMKLSLRELLGQKFYFGEITVHSPQLSLVRDADGRFNISEKLLHFFEKKSQIEYRIEEFNTLKGEFSLGSDERYTVRDVSLHLKPIASGRGVRTDLEGSASYYESRIGLDGWAYLKDEPKSFNVSVSSPDISLHPLKTFLGKYRVNAEKAKIAVSLHAEGDTEKGFRLISEIHAGRTGFPFLRREVKEFLVSARAFLDIPGKALLIEDASLRAGGVTAANASGKLRAAEGGFFYDGLVKIDRLDLSAFNFMKDLRVRGTVTSDRIRFSGNSRKRTPQVMGSLFVRDAAFRSKGEDIGKIQLRLGFSSGQELKVEAEGTGSISRVYGYPLERPGNMNITLNARRSHKGIPLMFSATVSPVELRLKEGRNISLGRIALTAEGALKGRDLLGEGSVEIRDVIVDRYRTPRLKAVSSFGYRDNVLTARGFSIEGKDFKASARSVTVHLPGEKNGDEMTARIENVEAPNLPGEAGFSKADLSARVRTEGGKFSGDFQFSVGRVMFRNARADSMKGRGAFDDESFSADISEARVSGGKLRFSARGKIAGGPFPLGLAATAEGIDLALLSKETAKITGIPYDISGNMKKAFFEGTVLSSSSLQGKAGLDAGNISLRVKEGGRNILKDFSLTGRAEFTGQDVEFRGEAAAGKLSASASGRVKGFLQENRSAELELKLPAVNAADIRDSFWDIFPDSLLYSGLEGALSSDLTVSYSRENLLVSGKITLDRIALRGENDEYEIGPVEGNLPIAYSKTGGAELIELPSFEKSQFGSLSRYYAGKPEGGHSRITIGSVRYGFEILDNLSVWITQKGTALNVKRFSGNIFGGRLNGSAAIDLSKGVSYRAGFLLEGLSLTNLCDRIEPIKGYISGKMNGTGLLRGSSGGLADLIGRADFWTFGTKDEKTRISKEFLKKMGGPSLKRYLGDRPFDKGMMDLYLQNGYVIFKDLEISHKNFLGMTDLSIKVAPYSNRIAIDHLMWSIIEAAQRAKNK